jgi:hypothetical protein
MEDENIPKKTEEDDDEDIEEDDEEDEVDIDKYLEGIDNMPTYHPVLEFLKTYGWAIVVLLIAIGALAYFGALSPMFNANTPVNYSIQDDVCSNLDINGSVFYTVVRQKTIIENAIGMRAVNIYGNMSTAKLWDNNGVMCEVPIELCTTPLVFCDKISMIVPVNYTEYNAWRSG